MTEVVEFSLAGGGAFDRFTRRPRMMGRVPVRVLLFVIIAWLPLLALSLLEGLAVGGAVRIPFLLDYGVYGRFLLAVPLLIMAEAPIGKRSRDVVQEFVTAKLVREQEILRFNDAVAHATRRKESAAAEIIVLAIVYGIVAFRVSSIVGDYPLTTWYRTDGGITPAAWYYAFVSLPLFQFLLIRWVWRLIVWAGLLWRISRLDLQLVAIHPDKMGGLGFLALAQIPCGIIGFAGGAVISGYLANGMVYRELSLTAASGPMVLYVILAVLIVLAPIFVFSDRLVRLRANGMLRYGDVGEEYARLFEDKWVKGMHPESETILGSSDIQSLADLRNSFDIVQNMSIVPVDRKTVTIIAAAAAVPMIPLFFVALPFYEIIARLLGVFG